MKERTIGHRRFIPMVAGIVAGLLGAFPIWYTGIAEWKANQTTLSALILMFMVKGAVFWWMRHRMVAKGLPFTVFGLALIDFFAAIVVGDVAIDVVFGVGWIYAQRCHCLQGAIPYWLRTGDRALLIGAVAYVIACAAAVAYEMRRAGWALAVHHDQRDRGN